MSGHKTRDTLPGSPALNPNFWFSGRKISGCKSSSLRASTKDEPTPVAHERCGLDNVSCEVGFVGPNDEACHLCAEHVPVFLALGGKIDSNSPPTKKGATRRSRSKEGAKGETKPTPQAEDSDTEETPEPQSQQLEPSSENSSKLEIADALEQAEISKALHDDAVEQQPVKGSKKIGAKPKANRKPDKAAAVHAQSSTEETTNSPAGSGESAGSRSSNGELKPPEYDAAGQPVGTGDALEDDFASLEDLWWRMWISSTRLNQIGVETPHT